MTPPPAPDLVAIFDVEGAIEPKITAGLQAAGIFDTPGARGAAELATPRVEVKIHLGECVTRTQVPTGATDRREALPSAWRCTFLFHVVTDRTKPEQATAHGQMRAMVRAYAARFWTLLNGKLPYHRLEEMKDMGTTPGMENGEARTEDISRLQFAGTVSVRSTAWPTIA